MIQLPSARSIVAVGLLVLAASDVQARQLPIRDGDSVVILGNAFAERMHLFGYFETYLHSRYPDSRLKVRNMGWSADEIGTMIRPLGFPDLFDELYAHQADLIFLCFGMNESFAGPEGVAPFRRELREFVEQLQQHPFNGETAPRIVLVSPIAHERIDRELPDGVEHNHDLRSYADAMAQIAEQLGIRCIDLFAATSQWMNDHPDKKLTFNGIHLTEYGDWAVSQMMARELGLIEETVPLTKSRDAVAEPFRRLVFEKNYYFENWRRPPNSSYIHGRRNDTPGAKHLSAERKQRLRLIEALDQDVWRAAKPSPADVWQREPVDGKPIWFPAPSDRPIPDTLSPPQWSVAEDGEADVLRTPDDQVRLFTTPDDYQVNLFASDVQFPIANPMAMQFDRRGRLWVANTPTWPHSLPGKQPGDSIVILEDADRDGVADKHAVFLEGLNLLHGFTLSGGDVYVAQTPNLILARDTDGDDAADWLRVALHGFGAEDAEHAMNNFRWGPDGSLYFSQGIFYHTQVETPRGPARVRDAAVFRYRPREQQLGVYVSHAFWNPYGNLFDRWGRGIVLDASAGQYYPMDVLSANYAYPKAKERTDHLSFAPGGSIAAGCEFLRSGHFPPEVQDRFLVNHCEGDVGVHWYTLKSVGSLYEAQRHEPSLLRSRDPAFRPVAMTLGPDGALYVADFYTHIFENVNFSKRHPGRDHSHGRIWRITCKQRPLLEDPKFEGRPAAELLELLEAYEDRTRELARRELQQREPSAVLPALNAWIDQLDPTDAEYERQLTEALWVRQSLNAIDVDLLKRLLAAKDPGARVAATQVLRFWQDRIDGSIDLIRNQIDDPDARVRLHAVLACGFSDSDEAIETALGAANHAMDPGLEHALDQTLEFLEREETARRE